MSNLTVYGADWCPDCRRSKRLLNRLGVGYEYIDVDADAAAMAEMMARNGGRQSIPVIVFPDGHHVVEPSDPQLRRELAAAQIIPNAVDD